MQAAVNEDPYPPLAEYEDEVVSRIIQHLDDKKVLDAIKGQLKLLAASESVNEATLEDDLEYAMENAGLNVTLQNHVYHCLRRNPALLEVLPAACRGGGGRRRSVVCDGAAMSFLRKSQALWNRRLQKSLNSMCTELNTTLIRPRSAETKALLESKWEVMSTADLDLSMYRPVYSPKDFLEVLISQKCPEAPATWVDKLGGLIQLPLDVPSLHELKLKFSDLWTERYHLGINEECIVNERGLTLLEDKERIAADVVVRANAAVSQQFLRLGCPHSVRAKLWAQVLGVDPSSADKKRYETLKGCVFSHELLLDYIVIKDVQLTTCNDDQYFVFEDTLYQTLLCFLRDREISRQTAEPPSSAGNVAAATSSSSSTPAATYQTSTSGAAVVSAVSTTSAANSAGDPVPVPVATAAAAASGSKCGQQPPIVGLVPAPTNSNSPASAPTVSAVSTSTREKTPYPPCGVIPFYGFSLYAAPLCFLYDDPVELYFMFGEFFTRYWHSLQVLSDKPDGILALSILLETLLQMHEAQLWNHFRSKGIQPLRLVFKWLMRAFVGSLKPEQVLILWDMILGYDSLALLPLLAAAIISLRRENLLAVTTPQAAEAVLADLSSIKIVPLLRLVFDQCCDDRPKTTDTDSTAITRN